MNNDKLITKICEATGIEEKDLMDLLEEKKKMSVDLQWDEYKGLLEVAKDLGVDIGSIIFFIENFGFNFENLDFTHLDLLEDEIYAFFENDRYDGSEKIELFHAIVDETNLSETFGMLLVLIELFRKDYDDDCLDYRFEAFEYLFNALSTSFIVEKLPELISVFNRLDYRLERYWTFFHMMNKISYSESIEKTHFSFLDTIFKKLLKDFYDLPYYLGKYQTKDELYRALEGSIKYTKILSDIIPNFGKLIEITPNYHFIYELKHHYLISLFSLLQGWNLTENQVSSLYRLFEELLDVFNKINKEEVLFQSFSILFDALMDNSSIRTRSIITKKIHLFHSNLSSIKIRFPKIWEEYESGKYQEILYDIKQEKQEDTYNSEEKEKVPEDQLQIEKDEPYTFDRTKGLTKVKSTWKEPLNQSILEKIDFETPLSEVQFIFKDGKYDDHDRFQIFCRTVDEMDLVENLKGILKLIEIFPKEYKNLGRDYRYEAFQYLYDAILEAGVNIRKTPTRVCPKCRAISTSWSKKCFSCNTLLMKFPPLIKRSKTLMMEKFPELLEFTTSGFLEYDRYHYYLTFQHMIQGIKHTEVMNKYFSLIENTFIQLVKKFYEMPDDLGQRITKQDLLNALLETIQGTELLQLKFPHISDLVGIIPPNPIYGYRDASDCLIALIGLKEGLDLTEFQYLDILGIFQELLDNFKEIHKENALFRSFSFLMKALMKVKPSDTEEILIRKIDMIVSNLYSLQQRFPNVWEEYQKVLDYSKLLNALYSNKISDIIKLLNTQDFEELIKRIYADPKNNQNVIQDITTAVEKSGFRNILDIWTMETDVNEYELKLLREFMVIVTNWQNDNFEIPEIDFLKGLHYKNPDELS